jgi:hypothetical protein
VTSNRRKDLSRAKGKTSSVILESESKEKVVNHKRQTGGHERYVDIDGQQHALILAPVYVFVLT